MKLSLLKPDKIVVFDVDETLGYFTQLGIFWDALNVYYKNQGDDDNILKTQQTHQDLFNTLIEIYPEFLRVNILAILNYLKRKQEKGKCKHIMIYTNNHASKDWINLIINYFHEKIKYKLFDRVIRAFKVNGKIIEMCRSTNEKTTSDLFNCTKIPENSQICFLDDVYYPNMVDENVYYIKLKPYTYNLPFELMIQRFILCKYGKKIKDERIFYDFMKSFIDRYKFFYEKKNENDYDLDKIVSKKIMIHLQTFFDKKWYNNDSTDSFGSLINMDNITIKTKNRDNKNRTKKYYAQQQHQHPQHNKSSRNL
jgi:hypothetical protein